MHARVTRWRSLTTVPQEQLPLEADRLAAERLLAAEARLIDSGQLDEWLKLYTEDWA